MARTKRNRQLETNCFNCFFWLLSLSFAVSVNAAEQTIEPTLTIGAGYTDNILLSHNNEKSSAYTRVEPGIKISREGARFKANIDYRASGLFYSSHGSLDEVRNYLFAQTTTELVKHTLFLDADARVSQENINRQFNSGTSSSVGGVNNLTETYTFIFSPYWKKKWGNHAQSELRYTYNEINFNEGSNSGTGNGDDSKENSVSLSVESGTALKRYFWTFDFDYKDINYDRRNDTTSEVYRLVTGYHYSRKIDVKLTTGYEDYDDGRQDSGFGWRLGADWRPTVRTDVSFEVGRRFYGTTYLFDFEHRSRRFTWHFNYDEDVTNTRDQISNNSLKYYETPDNIITPLSDFRAQYQLNKTFSGDVSFQYHRSVINFGVFDQKRYFYNSDKNDEEDIGFNLSWNYKLAKRTNMTTRWGQTYRETGQNTTLLKNKQDLTTFSWMLNHQLTPDTSGVLEVSYTENDADNKFSEYTESAISLNVTKRF